MNRFLRARTFTCRHCKTRKRSGDLATATSQAGLCIDCYAEGYRLERYFYGRGLAHTTDVIWWPSRVPLLLTFNFITSYDHTCPRIRAKPTIQEAKVLEVCAAAAERIREARSKEGHATGIPA